ncbi:MAG: M56 family metallopeptidase [Chthoniobacteraceae bacterium]
MNKLDSLVIWFAAASLRGALLILAVLALQALLRRTITPQWRYALWLPVVLVLISPSLPESRWSADYLGRFAFASWTGATSPSPATEQNVVIPPDLRGAPLDSALPESSDPAVATPPPSAARHWRAFAALIWISGVLGVLITSFAGYTQTWRRIVLGGVPPAPEVEGMLDRAIEACRLRKAPRIIVSQTVGSPAVAGFLRPTLLLPSGFPDGFTPSEAELVLRHELLHLKRLDLPVNWVLCLIQALHWFNPLVWLAVRRIRTDREAACDAQVLALDEGDRRAEYGHALLKLQSTPAVPGGALGFVGIFESGSALHGRLRDIAHYRPATPMASLFAAIVLVVLTLGSATRAQEEQAAAGPRDVPAKTVGNAKPVLAKETPDRDLRQKLRTLIIPRLEFHQATLSEALDFLKKKSMDLDTAETNPAQRGVNIVVRRSSTSAEPNLPQKERSTDAVEKAPRITLSLRNIPLEEALRYVAELAHLRISIEQDAVALIEKGDPVTKLVTKLWTLDDVTIQAWGGDLEGNERYDLRASLIAKGISWPAGASAVWLPSARRFIVRNTEANLQTIDRILASLAGGNAPSEQQARAEAVVIPALSFREASLREAVDFIKAKTAANPDRAGINIVLDVPASVEPPKITLTLKNVSAWDALRQVARVAGLELTADANAIRLHSAKGAASKE